MKTIGHAEATSAVFAYVTSKTIAFTVSIDETSTHACMHTDWLPGCFTLFRWSTSAVE